MEKSKSIIKMITHPHAPEIMMARQDQAHITGQPLVENPWWYEDTETGRLYHDLYACIGWPSEVSDNKAGLPGYAAIVGIVRPKDLDKDTHYDPVDAHFLLLAEAEDDDVPALLAHCVKMREKYGFGIQPDLLTVWLGDPDRFYRTLALANEVLIKRGGDRAAILLTPPDDFYTPSIFDNYIRSLKTASRHKRFHYSEKKILKSRLKKFYRDDPAAMAIGGLVHTLLSRCMWMGQSKQGAGCFSVDW